MLQLLKAMQMPIYIYKSSPASLKRKAEDIDESFDLERGNTPRQGRVTKKVKPTCGYVPGTGKPYRGTAREWPNLPPLGSIGILGDKSANVLSKRREAVAKQDTKNLNRNAPKAKVLNGVGVPSTCDDTLANIINIDGYEPTEPRSSQSCAARSHRRWHHQVSSAHQE